MSEESKYLDDLSQIRNMMEKSTRFLSLSGLSGIFVGLVALAGAGAAHYFYHDMIGSREESGVYMNSSRELVSMFAVKVGLISIATVVLIVALAGGYFFTARKAKKQGQLVWTKTSKDMLISLFVPFTVGGAFCLSLIYKEIYNLVTPCLLIFYGLSLFSSSKYTFGDIKWLGLCEVLLGFMAIFVAGNDVVFLSIGFGLLHIIYGVSMYVKYDLKK